MRYHPEAEYQQPARPRQGRRRRAKIPFIILVLAAIGFVTVVVMAMRYLIVPLLVLLGGAA